MTDQKDGTTAWEHDGAGGDETEIVNSASDFDQHRDTQSTPTAWSDYSAEEPKDLRWRRTWLIAAAIFVPLVVLAVVIGAWVNQLSRPSGGSEVLRPITVGVPPTSGVPPTITVTAPPPVTVTQTAQALPPPVTVTAPPPNFTFLVCPDGRTGVATNVTSCEFALNVHKSYLSQGGTTVVAYSPVTGDSYVMECHGGITSHLNNGLTVDSVRCVGGNNAVVILW